MNRYQSAAPAPEANPATGKPYTFQERLSQAKAEATPTDPAAVLRGGLIASADMAAERAA